MEIEPTHLSMPAEVATAITAVMEEVPKLGKGEKNQHANYNFASIDDFLEAVRPLCSKHGLVIVQDEDSFEFKEGQDKNGKSKMWLVMRFAFTLAHKSGVTWGHRPMRTIMVDASMGSQAFGAAQSYALKQFERSLFQIATGEKGQDADEHPNEDLPSSRRASAKRAPPETSSPSDEWLRNAITVVQNSPSMMLLGEWWAANKDHIASLNDAGLATLTLAKDNKKKSLEGDT